MENSFASSAFSMNCRGKLIDLSKPKIMGILNVTPDSFSDGGQFTDLNNALKHAEQMIKEGADILDIGAQSTRPNAEKISAEEEIRRIGNLISVLKQEFPNTLLSLDTFYADVVKFAFDEGLDLVNDISGGQFDRNLLDVVASLKLPYVLMHVNSRYQSMHEKLIDENIVVSINKYFSQKVEYLLSLGIKDILLDPGFGFGKTIEQQYQMIENLEHIGFGNFPLLVGISRKSFIYKPLGKLPTEIGEETQKLHLELLKKGTKILRVHDVALTKQTINAFLS